MKLMRMKSPGLRVIAIMLGMCLAMTCLTGCAEDPASVPPAESPYSLYGILNPASDTQMVRVFPIEPRLLPNHNEPLDATVTSTDLQTGEVLTWRDSILTFENGTYGFLYWVPDSIMGGHTYRIDVTRSDGAQSSATATVPLPPDLLVPTIDPWSAAVTAPVRLGGYGAHLLNVNVSYTVAYGWGGPQRRTITFPYVHTIRYDGHADLLEIALDADYRAIVDSLSRKGQYSEIYNVVPERIDVRARVTDAGWVPPDGEFDPEILIQPGVFDNVDNGFGFLGSGYDVRQEIELDDAVLEAAGFTPVEIPRPPPEQPPPPPPI